MFKQSILAASALAATLAAPVIAEDAMRFQSLAELPFAQNRATPKTAKTLRDELKFQQATQAYLWALPLINTLGMKFGSEEVFGAGYNILPIWKERLDPKTLVTTPNSDVIYAMSYIDMSETGPIVFEAPPNLQGILLDFWQRPIPVDGGAFAGDVGLPGPDAGKGGKFLVLPPGYAGEVPGGYYVYRSGTNNLFVFLRAFYETPDDLSPAVALLEQSKIYPLNLPEAERKPMEFPNASGVPANILPRFDINAFEQLKWLIDREGESIGSADMLGMLASVGLVQGHPTQKTVQTLYDEMDFQRASQAYLWGIPAVGINEWRKAQTDVFKAKNGELLSFLNFNEKLGILTPNFTTPYIVAVIDLMQSGPIVVEIPSGQMAGMIMDVWQRVLADLGVVGPDAGKGGKYLIVPPGYEGMAPEGYFVVQSPGRIVFAGVRLLDADKDKAIRDLIPGIKTYT